MSDPQTDQGGTLAKRFTATMKPDNGTVYVDCYMPISLYREVLAALDATPQARDVAFDTAVSQAMDAALADVRAQEATEVRQTLRQAEHVCGLSGYGHPDDPPCPGCVVSGRIPSRGLCMLCGGRGSFAGPFVICAACNGKGTSR